MSFKNIFIGFSRERKEEGEGETDVKVDLNRARILTRSGASNLAAGDNAQPLSHSGQGFVECFNVTSLCLALWGEVQSTR